MFMCQSVCYLFLKNAAEFSLKGLWCIVILYNAPYHFYKITIHQITNELRWLGEKICDKKKLIDGQVKYNHQEHYAKTNRQKLTNRQTSPILEKLYFKISDSTTGHTMLKD